MKKILFTIFCMSLLTTFYAQTVTLTFTGRSNNDNQYEQLDRVVVNNLTQNWQETLLWPDTMLTMTTTGIDDIETGGRATLQLSQNNPNPFNGTTYANLTVAESGNVTIEITDITGRVVGTNHFMSQSGIHQLRVTLSTAGMYFLTARMNGHVSSIKIVNQGKGSSDAIEYTGFAEMNGPSIPQKGKSSPKGNSSNPFQPGDQMEYVGFATINGAEVESQHITQAQQGSENIVLMFDVALPCPGTPTVSDIDGNVYNTVQIGNQCWMKENLRTTKYASGTSIALGSAGPSTNTTTPYRYYPNDNSSLVSTHGYMYNWRATMGNSSSSNANPSGVQGICPDGWHVPSDSEWTQLSNYVSGQSQYVCDNNAFNNAKALASTTGWNTSDVICSVGNTPSENNATGFSAFPTGKYGVNQYGSAAIGFGEENFFWSTSDYGDRWARYRKLYYMYTDMIGSNSGEDIRSGFSVRCIRN